MFDATVRSRHLIALYRLWNARLAGRPLPARADFDPIDMVALLPHLYLLDVGPVTETATPRFRYRLIGTAIVNLLGRDSTGKYVAEPLHGDRTVGLQRLFTLVAETRAPVVIKGHIFYIRDKSWVFVEALLLPLSADGGTVDMIMAGMVQTPTPTERAGADTRPGVVEIFAEPLMRAYCDPVIDGIPCNVGGG